MTLPRRFPLSLLLALLPVLHANAGLLANGTRVIYPDTGHGQHLMVSNTNPWPVLVQTWVDQGEGDLEHTEAPFIVTPAIFRLPPAASQSLRILHTGETLPKDRESLFWLNLYEIPPNDSEGESSDARLTLTLNTQLKVLYRPEGIAPPETLAEQLAFNLDRDAGQLCADNPTPWHASLAALWLDSPHGPLPLEDADLLLPPFSGRCYRLPDGLPEMETGIGFSLIGDSGDSVSYSRQRAI